MITVQQNPLATVLLPSQWNSASPNQSFYSSFYINSTPDEVFGHLGLLLKHRFRCDARSLRSRRMITLLKFKLAFQLYINTVTFHQINTSEQKPLIPFPPF